MNSRCAYIDFCFVFAFRMQQQQLAAQLAHHGSGARPPPLSPAPHTSDSDSDISLGAHSPPISSPGPISFRSSSPNPLTSFRFGPHSPGPMPPQFRFGGHTAPLFRLDTGQSPPSFLGHQFNLGQKYRPDSPPETAANYSRTDTDSPINVDSTDIKDSSDEQTTLTRHSPPMNLRISDHIRGDIRVPEPMRLTQPLSIQVAKPRQLPPPQTALTGAPHTGIVRIAPSTPPPITLHRPFSPPRLT